MPAEAAAPAPAATALTCPSCGGTVAIKAAGYSVTVACSYCGSILDVSRPEVRLIAAYHEAASGLAIPLGTRGTLRGVEWEAIGYLGRSENGNYAWEEYLLFNPYHGYRWLIATRGGWSLGEQLTVVPSRVGRDMRLGNERYGAFFANGTARVDYVFGEFYWRVRRGDRVETADWVRPGFMLSREADGNEVSWSRSEMLAPQEIARAFGVDASARPWPPLPHQPSPHRAFVRQSAPVALLAAALLLVVAIFAGGRTTLYSGTLPIAADGSSREVTIGPLSLGRSYQPVTVSTRIPQLSNGWVDLDYMLVDRSNQRSFTAYKAAERYSGYDSDGSWSEGSDATAAHFASVPRGDYDLVLEHTANQWTGAQNSGDWRRSDFSPPLIDVHISSGGFPTGILFLAFLLIGLPIGYALFQHLRFEGARVGESDFAPGGDD
ncbi:DUF4178 domain-containing protein [Sphingomonas sp. ac-8]|uniref:DUF4178 domain-containing protein n=1 Tax=Sphingomonas sp. ac-8 TaxID=3242977 RepID=UPI003A806FC8